MNTKKEKVIAVVVTYNRKQLLLECLQAILNQSYPVSKIILIDNASTDGTKEELVNNGYMDNTILEYHLMDINTGGSGGFYEGIKLSNEYECDWVWVMDDDTIPHIDCLEKLIKANDIIKNKKVNNEIEFAYNPSFYASAIYGNDGEFMNVPVISSKKSRNGYQYWYNFLNDGMVNIKNATFVSILINKKAIQQCGLPCRDYFIWGDDTEYTTRLTKFFGDAYLVGNSVAIHKRIGAKELNIRSENDINRIKMYVYFYRNNLINLMYYDNHKCKYLDFCKLILKILFKSENSLERVRNKVILKGQWQAVRQYEKFKNYIDAQLKNGKD